MHSKKLDKLHVFSSLFVVTINFHLNHCLKLFEIANFMSCFINRHAFCNNLLRSDEILTCPTARFSLINVFLNSYIIMFLGIGDLLIINSFVRFRD